MKINIKPLRQHCLKRNSLFESISLRDMGLFRTEFDENGNLAIDLNDVNLFVLTACVKNLCDELDRRLSKEGTYNKTVAHELDKWTPRHSDSVHVAYPFDDIIIHSDGKDNCVVTNLWINATSDVSILDDLDGKYYPADHFRRLESLIADERISGRVRILFDVSRILLVDERHPDVIPDGAEASSEMQSSSIKILNGIINQNDIKRISTQIMKLYSASVEDAHDALEELY